MDLGEKERDAAPGGGEHVAVLVVETLEQAFAPQASQVVAHLADAVSRAQEGGYQGAQVRVGNPVGRPEELTAGVEQGRDAGLAHLQGEGGLPVRRPRRVDQLGQARRRQPTVVREAFSVGDAAVDVIA